MSNQISLQIKRGSSVPTTSQLAEYELGFNTTNNTLYINNGTEVIIPITKVGSITPSDITWGSQTANYVFSAPSGAAGTPSFRALVAADIPNLAASKITSGTLAIARGGTGAATAAINTVFAGPGSGSTAAPSFRALVAADIPNLNASKITAGTFDVARIPNLSASKITDGTLAVAQGGTGLTSLDTFVRTTGAQTIAGQKTFSNNIQLSAVNVGLYAKDDGDNAYSLIINNSSNLWIGAGSSTSVHHKGGTYISTGIDSEGAGNDSIHISVPTRSGQAGNYTFTATNYDVWSTKTLKIQHGFATISTTAPSSNNITYSGFTTIPKVFATYNIDATSITGDNTGDKGAIKIYNISTSGCKVVIGGSATGSMRIAWLAIGT